MRIHPPLALSVRSLVLLAAVAAPVGAQLATTPNATPGQKPAARSYGTPPAAAVGGLKLLVYDNNTYHQLAHSAALSLSPGGTTVGDTNTFNQLLAIGGWDAVAVDCPSSIPSGGWTDLINYVAGGGRVVMSFWDWDTSGSSGDPALPGAFDCSIAQDISLTGKALVDSGTSSLFSGVTQPNFDWHDHWSDDGDEFIALNGAVGVANVGNPLTPVMVHGNGGRTISAPALDEAGDTWLNDGSGVQLWVNMLNQVLNGGATCELRFGILGVNPADCACNGAPVVGQTWNPTVSATPTIGTTTIATLVTVGMGGPTQGALTFGHELLILPPYFTDQAMGNHSIPIANHPVMVGWTGTLQGARVETDATGSIYVVLMNALDVTANP